VDEYIYIMFGRGQKQAAKLDLMQGHGNSHHESRIDALSLKSPGSILVFVGVLANALLFALSVYFLFYASSSLKKNKNTIAKTAKKKGQIMSKSETPTETEEMASLAESTTGGSSSSSLDGDSVREVRGVDLYGPYPKVRTEY
jgi:hypothetical protein